VKRLIAITITIFGFAGVGASTALAGDNVGVQVASIDQKSEAEATAVSLFGSFNTASASSTNLAAIHQTLLQSSFL
jgi:hypothetical protein